MNPYFQNHLGSVYCADASDLCRHIAEHEKADLIVTSPPYGNLRKYQGFSFDVKEVSKSIGLLLRDNGVCVWVVADQTVNGCEQLIPFKHAKSFIDAGISLYDTMIWEKPSPAVPTEGRYYDVFEFMFVFCKGKKPRALNLLADRKNRSTGFVAKRETRSCREDRRYHHGVNSDRVVAEYSRRFNVWNISRGRNSTEHPAVFPVSLARDHILSWSNENDLVVDPMAGSGTTAIAAMQTGRRFIVGDVSERYCEIIAKRLEDESSLI